jgi:hypothetical protein
MRAPLPFAVVTRPLPGLNRVWWLLTGIGVSITAHWAAGRLQAPAAWQWAVLALPIAAALVGALRAGDDEPVTIAWDGQCWHLQDGQGAGAGTPVLALDAGAWLLLRWHPLPGGPPPRWIQTRIAPHDPGQTRLKVMLLRAHPIAGHIPGDTAQPTAESMRR